MTLLVVSSFNGPFSIASVVSYIGQILTADRKKVPEKREVRIVIHLVLQSGACVFCGFDFTAGQQKSK